MKQSILVLLALAIGCATGAAIRDVVAPVRAQGQTGPSYEYDAVALTEYWSETQKRKEVLAKYGREGWHLSGVTEDKGATTLYFERQLPR